MKKKTINRLLLIYTYSFFLIYDPSTPLSTHAVSNRGVSVLRKFWWSNEWIGSIPLNTARIRFIIHGYRDERPIELCPLSHLEGRKGKGFGYHLYPVVWYAFFLFLFCHLCYSSLPLGHVSIYIQYIWQKAKPPGTWFCPRNFEQLSSRLKIRGPIEPFQTVSSMLGEMARCSNYPSWERKIPCKSSFFKFFSADCHQPCTA